MKYNNTGNLIKDLECEELEIVERNVYEREDIDEENVNIKFD